MSYEEIDEGMTRANQRHSAWARRLFALRPSEQLAEIVAATDEADPADLGWFGVGVIEALLDSHGDEVADAFEDALKTHKKLAIAYASAAIQSDELFARFELLVPPDEESGRSD